MVRGIGRANSRVGTGKSEKNEKDINMTKVLSKIRNIRNDRGIKISRERFLPEFKQRIYDELASIPLKTLTDGYDGAFELYNKDPNITVEEISRKLNLHPGKVMIKFYNTGIRLNYEHPVNFWIKDNFTKPLSYVQSLLGTKA